MVGVDSEPPPYASATLRNRETHLGWAGGSEEYGLGEVVVHGVSGRSHSSRDSCPVRPAFLGSRSPGRQVRPTGSL